MDAELISTYFTDKVDFNRETRQVTLQAKNSAVPVVAMKRIMADQSEGVIYMDVPVIVGLNDSNYEKNLNETILQEMQAYADAFMEAEAENDNLLMLELKTGFCTKDFLSLYWEGTKDGAPVKLTKNIDLLGQKTVTLADLLKKSALEEVRTAAGAGWTEDRFFLTADASLVLLEGADENNLELHYWTREGKPLEWKDTYQKIFQRKAD